MAARENLIPTRTVDKNGRLTTVYRKPSAAGTATMLPRVTSASGSNAKQRKSLTRSILKGWPEYDKDSRKQQNMMAVLGGSTLETLVQLDRLRVNDSGTFTLLSYLAMDGGSDVQLREAICFYPDMPHHTYFVNTNIMKSLREYPQFKRVLDLSAESEEVQAQARALVRVTDGLRESRHQGVFRNGAPHFVIEDEKLVEFVLNHPDESGVVADLLRERGPVDISVLEQLLVSDAPALGTGLL